FLAVASTSGSMPVAAQKCGILLIGRGARRGRSLAICVVGGVGPSIIGCIDDSTTESPHGRGRRTDRRKRPCKTKPTGLVMKVLSWIGFNPGFSGAEGAQNKPNLHEFFMIRGGAGEQARLRADPPTIVIEIASARRRE